MNKLPKVVFKKIDIKLNEDIIQWTFNDKDDKFDLKNKTIGLFPDIKKNDDISTIIERDLSIYEADIDKAVARYQEVWNKYNDSFMFNLSQAFNIEWPLHFPDIVGYVGIIPIYPRFLNDKSFATSYWCNDDFVIDMVAHECCHFLYFEKWKQLFPGCDEQEFESPHLIWELSEMVIDPILNREEFKKIFNYDFRSYSYFYINNQEEMNIIADLYKRYSIEEAMVKSYEYLKNTTEKKQSLGDI